MFNKNKQELLWHYDFQYKFRTSYQVANLHWKSWFSKWQKYPKIWLKFWNIPHIKKSKKKSEKWCKTFRMFLFCRLQNYLWIIKKNKKKLKYVWNGILIFISHHGINFNFLCEYTLDLSQVLCPPTPRREAKQCGVTSLWKTERVWNLWLQYYKLSPPLSQNN